MNRIVSRVRRPLLPGRAVGGFDRIHDGLVSGWFVCSSCGIRPTPRIGLLLDSQRVAAIASATPRGDVPGGQGFLFRFAPARALAPRVLVQCRDHPDHGLEVQAEPTDWCTGVLGAIETSKWPIVTGWIAVIDPTDSPPELAMPGYQRLPVRGTAPRPDVQVYLGDLGVGGFHLDLGANLCVGIGPPLGTALFDGTALQLKSGDRVLTTAEVEDSPLGPDDPGCLAAVDGPSVGANERAGAKLLRRFLTTEIDSEGDWRAVLTRLGLEDHSAETEQWASYLAHLGCTDREVASRLAIRSTQRLAANAVSPLPASLKRVVGSDAGELPDAVLAWGESVIGVNYKTCGPMLPELVAAVPNTVDKVIVAGLVHHRSGLGQNARNSLRALELAGIHGCAAPFFPAPGGWNPRLSGKDEEGRALEDHAVLLHLPIDRVITGLSAQPALVRTDRLIGYFMWETEAIPRQFHRALNIVDEIWTATSFVADALQAVTDIPVHVTGHVVDTGHVTHVDRSELGIADDAFVVHYAFDANSTAARKNPNGAIKAFHDAFARDPSAVFVLKVRNMQQVHAAARQGDAHSRDLLERLDRDPAVRVITGEHEHAYALGLIQLADCYLSLHRSEGYGYGIAEAMALGTPVIATNYSGSTDLATNDTAWIVGYDEVDVAPGEYFYWEPGMTWAEPHTDVAALLLQRLREGSCPDLEAARKHVDWVASIGALSARYEALLVEQPNGPAD